MTTRPIPPELISTCAAYKAGLTPDRSDERVAVKYVARTLEELAPGGAVEVRVPPYVAFQVVQGTRHRRGTPPATVECDAQTFIELACGLVAWSAARADGRLQASGERSDLSVATGLGLFPVPEFEGAVST